MRANHRQNAGLLSLVVANIVLIAATQVHAAHRSLMTLVPDEAIVVIEKRAMADVTEAFAKSNLGAMAADEAIGKFFSDSRVRIEAMIAENLLDPDDEQQADSDAKALHSALRAAWHKPGVFFLTPNKQKLSRTPGMGYICVAGDMGGEAHKALETLVARFLDSGSDRKHYDFTYTKGLCTWKGITTEGPLPTDELKRNELLRKTRSNAFMVCRMDMIVCVATRFDTAEAISNMLTSAQAKRKSDNKNLAHVMNTTAQKDWVYRWYVDLEAILKAEAKEDPEATPEEVRAMQLDRIVGIGGSGGFADGAFSDRIFVYAPQADGGLFKALAANGSYKAALAMTPSESVFRIAAQADTDQIFRLCKSLMEQANVRPTPDLMEEAVEVEGKEAEAAEEAVIAAMKAARQAELEATTKPHETVEVTNNETRPTESKATSKPHEAVDVKTRERIDALEKLAGACDGNASFFLTNLQGLMGLAMGGGRQIPVGFVLGLKDAKAAEKAVDRLVKLEASQDADENDEDQPAKPYRKVKIRHIENGVSLAILEDRAILAFSDSVMKAAIDAAMDKTGGLSEDAQVKQRKLLASAGDGSLATVIDIKSIVKLAWPFIEQAAMHNPGDLPLASIPSTGKMVRSIGAEVLVIEPVKDGLLLKSRGQFPMGNLMPPFAGGGAFVYMMFRAF